MFRRLHLSCLILILISGCIPTASPTPPTVATITQTITPSPTFRPTTTTTPSVTPYPPLHTQGPYLLFTRDHKSLTIMDADGSGRKQIQLPNNGQILGYIEDAISPDGKWLAYFTGSKDEPFDLALNLFNLQEETTLLVANLIASDFPQNLEPVAKTLPKELCSGEVCLHLAENAFSYGIQAFDWSPDGKHLAFAAQIDGSSSDVYVYSLEDNSIRRMTKDIQNVLWIEWSPKGNKILYTNSIPGTIYIGKTLHVADFSNQSIQDPKTIYEGTFWTGYSWLSGDQYLIYSTGDTGPQHALSSVNIETRKVKEIWSYRFEYLVIDPQTKDIILSTIPWSDPTTEPATGTYLLSMDGASAKISDDLFVLHAGFQESQFFGITNSTAYSIKTDGSKQLIGPSKWSEITFPTVSPDKRWFILYENEKKISLYSDNLKLVRSWVFNDYLYNISWRPDSLGVSLSGDNFIYYLSLPNGEPIPLDDCFPVSHCGSKEFVWLP